MSAVSIPKSGVPWKAFHGQGVAPGWGDTFHSMSPDGLRPSPP